RTQLAFRMAAGRDHTLTEAGWAAGWAWRISQAVGPDLAAFAVFAAVIALLYVGFGGRPPVSPSGFQFAPLGAAMVGIAVVLLWRRWRGATGAALVDALIGFVPLLLGLGVYDNFDRLTYLVRPVAVDGLLGRLDGRLF